MDIGIAITLGRRCMKIDGAVLLRNLERIQCPSRAYQQRLDSQPGVVSGTCRRCEVEDQVYGPNIERPANILSNKLKPRLSGKMREVCLGARAEVIYADDAIPFPEQRIA